MTAPKRAEAWQLVPVEPTPEMLNAAIDVDSFKLGDISPLGFRCSPQQLFERCYAAMLSAAPAPPESERDTARDAELMALLVTARDYVAAEVERLASAYGHQLQHKQQPGRDDLAAIDAAIAGERDE